MPRELELFDGTVLEFPDGTTDDVMLAAGQRETARLRDEQARQPLPPDVQPSTAGQGRSAGVGGPTRQDMARPGTLRTVTPYGAGDPRINPPPAEPAPGDSVLDRPLPPPSSFAEATQRKRAMEAFAADSRRGGIDPAEAAQFGPGAVGANDAGIARKAAADAEVRPTGTVRGLSMPEVLADRFSPTKVAADALRPKPLDRSVAGFVRDTAADAIGGWRQAAPDLNAAMYGGVRALADVAGASGVAQWAGLSADAAKDFGALFSNPNGDHAVSGAFRSLAQAAMGGGLGGTVGAVGVMVGSTGGNKYNELRNLGMPVDAALEGSAVHSLAEYLGERIGMPGLARIVNGIASKGLPARDALKEALKQQGEEQLTTALQDLYDKFGRAGTRPNMGWKDYLDDVIDTAQQTLIMTAAAGAGGAIKRAAGQGARRMLGVPEPAPAPAVDPYQAASAVGFHVEPPLVTDTPVAQRKKTEAILDGVAAQYGIPPRVMQMLRKGAEGKPLADLGPTYAAGIQWLQQRGLVSADIAPEVLQALTHGAVAPPAAEGEGKAPAAAPAAAKPEAKAEAATSSIESTLRSAGALPGAGAAPAPPSSISDAAHQAATSPLNDLPEPTDAQKAAGNYTMGHVRLSGFDVSIENPQGSVRRSKADAAKPWEVTMPAHYGYIRGTKGADGDHVDLFIGPGEDNGRFWIINQTKAGGKGFDEHKVVTGVDSADEAVALYKASFADNFGDRVFGSVGTELTAEQLRDVLPALEQPKPFRKPAPPGAPAPAPAPAAAAAAPAPRLQNRTRSDAGYVQQMQSIAANPDPGRLGFSRDFAAGAPVVLDAGSTPGAVYGRTDYATTSKGRRIPVRYAVVEADALLPSNTATGAAVAGYDTGLPGRARVIAGNGRTAGLVAAYERGTTKGYGAGLAEDASLHGIDAAAIARFKRPVLVREMGAADLTADIGDESNVSGIAERSSPEVARDDARRIDLAALEFDEDGNLTDQALRRFVDSMPTSEQTALRDARGAPTRQAGDRLTSAVFAAAYESDALLALQAQAADPEARTILTGLVAAAPAMARLRGLGDLDIRPLVSEAAEAAVNARRRGIKLADMAAQADLDASPEITPLLEMFARNVRSARRIGDNLRAAANLAYEEATKPAEDMLGEVPKRSRQEVLKEASDDAEGSQGLGQPTGAEPAPGDARRRPAEAGAPGSRGGAEESAGRRPARSAQQAEVIELRKRVSVLESLRACLAS